jgi:hypothetical protein
MGRKLAVDGPADTVEPLVHPGAVLDFESWLKGQNWQALIQST